MTDQARFEAALQRANHVVFLLKAVRDQLMVLQAMEADATRDLEAARDALLAMPSSHMDPHPILPLPPLRCMACAADISDWTKHYRDVDWQIGVGETVLELCDRCYHEHRRPPSRVILTMKP